jgi:hypothetical protein
VISSVVDVSVIGLTEPGNTIDEGSSRAVGPNDTEDFALLDVATSERAFSPPKDLEILNRKTSFFTPHPSFKLVILPPKIDHDPLP